MNLQKQVLAPIKRESDAYVVFAYLALLGTMAFIGFVCYRLGEAAVERVRQDAFREVAECSMRGTIACVADSKHAIGCLESVVSVCQVPLAP